MAPRILSLIVALGLAGCDDTVFPGGAGGTDVPAAYTPDYAGVNALFDDHCLGCHGTGTAPTLPDDLTADLANGTGAIVVAGDPDASPLWRVIALPADQLDPADAGVMPFGSQLPAAQVAHVKAWIEGGALTE